MSLFLLLLTLAAFVVLVAFRFLLAVSWLMHSYDEAVRLGLDYDDMANPVWQMFDLTQWRYRSPAKD